MSDHRAGYIQNMENEDEEVREERNKGKREI